MLFFCSGPDGKICKGPTAKYLKPLFPSGIPPGAFCPSSPTLRRFVYSLFPGEFRRCFFILFSRSLLRTSFPCVSSSYIADYPHPEKPAKKEGRPSFFIAYRSTSAALYSLYSLAPLIQTTRPAHPTGSSRPAAPSRPAPAAPSYWNRAAPPGAGPYASPR